MPRPVTDAAGCQHQQDWWPPHARAFRRDPGVVETPAVAAHPSWRDTGPACANIAVGAEWSEGLFARTAATISEGATLWPRPFV